MAGSDFLYQITDRIAVPYAKINTVKKVVSSRSTLCWFNIVLTLDNGEDVTSEPYTNEEDVDKELKNINTKIALYYEAMLR